MGAAARLLDGHIWEAFAAPPPEERLTYLLVGRYSRHIYFEPCSQAYTGFFFFTLSVNYVIIIIIIIIIPIS